MTGEFWLGMAAGGYVGTAITLLATGFFARRHQTADAEPELTAADYEEIGHEFGAHVRAVDAQVSEFADQLAGEDPVLREQLRRFERGGRS